MTFSVNSKSKTICSYIYIFIYIHIAKLYVLKRGGNMHNVPWNIVQASTNGLYLRRQRTMLCQCERKWSFDMFKRLFSYAPIRQMYCKVQSHRGGNGFMKQPWDEDDDNHDSHIRKISAMKSNQGWSNHWTELDGGEAAANHLKNSAHGGEILQVVNAFFGGGLNRSAL